MGSTVNLWNRRMGWYPELKDRERLMGTGKAHGHGLKTFWNRLLIKMKLRVDWDNPLITPPAFRDVKPHVYDPEFEQKELTFCALCGAGRLHPIHSVKVSTGGGTLGAV
jgi:hypothetical protein